MEYTAPMKKTYTPAFKAQVVQELLKETRTLTQLATDHTSIRTSWYQYRKMGKLYARINNCKNRLKQGVLPAK